MKAKKTLPNRVKVVTFEAPDNVVEIDALSNGVFIRLDFTTVGELYVYVVRDDEEARILLDKIVELE